MGGLVDCFVTGGRRGVLSDDVCHVDDGPRFHPLLSDEFSSNMPVDRTADFGRRHYLFHGEKEEGGFINERLKATFYYIDHRSFIIAE